MGVVSNVNGVQTVIELQGDDLVTGTIQDCTPFVEYAHAMRAAGNVGSSEFRYAMTIPDVIQEQYCNLNGISYREWMTNPEHLKRLLNSPDFKKLRIWEGRV